MSRSIVEALLAGDLSHMRQKWLPVRIVCMLRSAVPTVEEEAGASKFIINLVSMHHCSYYYHHS